MPLEELCFNLFFWYCFHQGPSRLGYIHFNENRIFSPSNLKSADFLFIHFTLEITLMFTFETPVKFLLCGTKWLKICNLSFIFGSIWSQRSLIWSFYSVLLHWLISTTMTEYQTFPINVQSELCPVRFSCTQYPT